jgi:hypothetical protein
MNKLIADKPWILILVAFTLLISSWTAFITLAVRNPTAFVPVQQMASNR